MSIVKELIEFGKEKECYKIILNCKDHYVGFYQKMGLIKLKKCLTLTKACQIFQL